jgi:hypothetical protein
MALSFDILGGQYLEMIEALRKAFSQRSPALLEVKLSGTLNNKPRSVTVGIETSSPYYVKTINGHKLSATEESYANKPMPHPFNLTHIHAALGMSGAQRNEAEKKAFVSLIFITSEAARFEPFARHINTLIKAGDGARVLDYERARYYMNNWKSLYDLTYGDGAVYFKPLTEANMHNWNYYHQIVVQKGDGNMRLPFSATQASLQPKSLRDLR